MVSSTWERSRPAWRRRSQSATCVWWRASGATDAIFTVSLAFATGQPVTVRYATVDGTALAGSDYGATSGTLSFAPGQTTATIRVPVSGDALSEPDEAFAVTLSGPSADHRAGHRRRHHRQRRRILGGRHPAGGGEWALDGGDVHRDPVGSRRHAGDGPVGDARGRPTRLDFGSTAGTLTFAPGQTTATATVRVYGDTLAEADETFSLRLGDPTGGVLLVRATAVATIVDDDARTNGTLFVDNFGDLAPSSAWSTVGGDWVQSGGVLRQAGLGAADPKKASVAGVAFPTDVEVRAASRSTNGPAATPHAPASASATTTPGAATTSSSTATPTPCSSSTTTSPGATATTSPGGSGCGTASRLRQQGGVLLGKVWADGQAEPEGWMFRQDGWAPRAGRRGSTAAPMTPPPPASTTSMWRTETHLVLLCHLRRGELWYGHEFTQHQFLDRLDTEPVVDPAMHRRQRDAPPIQPRGKSPTRASSMGSVLTLMPLVPDQIAVGQHHRHRMPVEARPQPAPVLVPAQEPLGLLVEQLHPMPPVGILHQPLQGDLRAEVAPVVARLPSEANSPMSQPARPRPDEVARQPRGRPPRRSASRSPATRCPSPTRRSRSR